ncbi:Fungal specific transcription factor domain containing protein [Hyaloscypha variabilis]
MSQVPPVTISPSENNASSTAPAAAPVPKRRSCVVCRTRKVRCDKQSPCSNCHRANIACVFPSTDRPPRWARRQASTAPAQMMQRLQNLESLVKDLSGQLEQANAAAATAASVAGGSSGVSSPKSSNQDRDTDSQKDALQKPFGRLVLQDANRSRYVGSGFWSRVDDELDGFGSDTSEEEDDLSSGKSPATQELQRLPSERHGFLFGHNLNPSAPNIREFHPLPSQIPFLLDIFFENVNAVSRIVHGPTLTKIARDLRTSDFKSLTPANEALMFSVYYSAINSMDEDDVMTNFGLPKSDLNLKYRVGLELALAQADFLNNFDLVLLQAFTIFLYLVRRHDSPRFVWMMTGLAIRMGQALGLHRDGSNFKNLTPYDIEMRRRVWWSLCMLDVRASEDQGMEYTLALGSYDTKLPLNINETDIDPKSTQMPIAREGITDMTFPLVSCEIGDLAKQMMTLSSKGSVPDMEEQNRLLNEMYQVLERGYLQYTTEAGNILYWIQVSVVRLVMGKMTLITHLPLLFSSPNEHFSDKIRTKLLIAAIEVAEYNHALNAEPSARQWRWVYQTYIHWHAVVYLLIEICRRPWSPIVERAWVALHSEWLIPAQSNVDKNLRVWVPLKKMMAKAKKHREAELEGLRRNPQSAKWPEMEEKTIPAPGSPGLFPPGSNVAELYRERWRQLFALPGQSENTRQTSSESRPEAPSSSVYPIYAAQQNTNAISGYNQPGSGSNTTYEQPYLDPGGLPTSQNLSSSSTPNPQIANPPSNYAMPRTTGQAFNNSDFLVDWAPGLDHWLWADANPSVDPFANVDFDANDVNMDIDGDIDWYNWVESAKGMEWDANRPV